MNRKDVETKIQQLRKTKEGAYSKEMTILNDIYIRKTRGYLHYLKRQIRIATSKVEKSNRPKSQKARQHAILDYLNN